MIRRYYRPLLLTLVVYVVSCAVLSPFTLDSTYAGFRFSQQLADGNGVRFNPDGPETDGFSSWLWFLLGAVFARLGGDLPVLMTWISALFGFVTIVVLWRHLVSGGGTELEVFLPLALLGASAPYVLYTVSGTEHSLFSLLLLLTVLSATRAWSGRRAVAIAAPAVCGSLLVLCRPEGVFVLPAIVAAQRLARRPASNSVYAAGIVLLFAGAFFVWRAVHFGSVLPPVYWNSAAAGVLQTVTGNLLTYFVSRGYDFPASGYYYAVTALTALAGWILAGRTRARTETAALAVAGSLSIVYLFFDDPGPGMRFHAALLPLLMLPGVHVAGALCRLIDAVYARRRAAARGVVVMMALVASAGWVAELNLVGKRIHDTNRTTVVALARWLGENIPKGSVLATDTPGILPYYSGLRTIAVQPSPISGGGDFSLQKFFETPPDVIVVQSRGIFRADLDPLPKQIVTLPGFFNRYRDLGAIRIDWLDDLSFWMFARKDMVIPEEQLDQLPQGVGSVRRAGR
jgi:hypothetical protein